MNYLHAFHAGNFADLVKHATLLQLLERLAKTRSALSVLDTHAGRGLYNLSGNEAVRSGEAAAGIARLMQAKDLPAVFAGLRKAVTDLNTSGPLRFYPGSPCLVAGQLRSGDSYLGCELRPDEQAALVSALKPYKNAHAICSDGYGEATRKPINKPFDLILIDPPFERADDYARIVQTLAAVAKVSPHATSLIWLPMKDLETFDSLLRELEEAGIDDMLIAETRMRPLSDPMKMNGCALLLTNPPPEFATVLSDICSWVAETLGDHGQARVWHMGPP